MFGLLPVGPRGRQPHQEWAQPGPLRAALAASRILWGLGEKHLVHVQVTFSNLGSAFCLPVPWDSLTV